MKFLCVPCDQPMVLSEKKGPDQGSISLVYSCRARVEILREYCEEQNLPFHTVSAVSGEGIAGLMRDIAVRLADLSSSGPTGSEES